LLVVARREHPRPAVAYWNPAFTEILLSSSTLLLKLNVTPIVLGHGSMLSGHLAPWKIGRARVSSVVATGRSIAGAEMFIA